ncbi:hypothetical protein CBF34_00740 [Vagococcus penaei]|uniref:Uncharacterized protein n=1 Tax=Vagococcus penaei TaxID=633807 RepID=A0A1Q2D5D7_9ENTE|nr:hypothetical protein [Vagococcus penaei]AQP53622.1 hypothetical protein BW732_04820 [Vagococcus penaei]RSU07567.1 hypothetical protein CBF34_00740 [Vagococcus penaei]
MNTLIRQNLAYIYTLLYIILIFLLGLPLIFASNLTIQLIVGSLMLIASVWIHWTTKKRFYFEDALNYYTKTFRLSPLDLATLSGLSIEEFSYSSPCSYAIELNKMPLTIKKLNKILIPLEKTYGKMPPKPKAR